EKVEDQLEREARYRQLMAHSSHDSAIDTDSMEWETEVDNMDLKALGFDVTEGVTDPYLPGDCGIFVSRVDKGSLAEGRLRVNDWLVRINDVDLTNKDRKQAIRAVLGSDGGVINMVVRRRRSLAAGRLVTPVQLSLINGIAVDNKSLSECEALLRSCRDSLSVSLMKSLLFDGDRSPGGRPRSCELHARSCRHAKHNNNNNSTQTDIYSPALDCPAAGGGGGREGSRKDVPPDAFLSATTPPPPPPPYHLKPFSSGSLHSHPLTHRGGGPSSSVPHTPPPPPPPEPPSHLDFCCRRPELHPHHHHLQHQHPRRPPSTFTPPSPGDVSAPDPAFPGGGTQSPPPPPPEKPSGGTWPKVVGGGGGTSVSEFAQLSIFKRPKQRKSIFDVDAFKRPEVMDGWMMLTI
ncbi:hypothetical protein CRUP_002845, partial [Coryphaenoides rupestris]